MYVPSIAFAFVLLLIFSQIGSVPGMVKILLGHVIIVMPYIVRNTLSYWQVSTGLWKMLRQALAPTMFRLFSR
jgi:ABC-type spermidine/putrescine transport system permease subunit II